VKNLDGLPFSKLKMSKDKKHSGSQVKNNTNPTAASFVATRRRNEIKSGLA
jgi:hypothetical protein